MSTEYVQPVTAGERALWEMMLVELPNGVRPTATRWRNGEYQVHADLPRRWHRPGSRIPQSAYGRGPNLGVAIREFRDDLASIRTALEMPGQVLYREPAP